MLRSWGRSRPAMRLAAAVLVAAAATAATGPAADGAGPDAPRLATVTALTLIAQDHLSLPVGGSVTLTVAAPAGVDLSVYAAPGPPDTVTPASTVTPVSTSPVVAADVVVTAFPKVDTRFGARAALDSPIGDPVSSVILPATGLTHPAADQLALTVPTNAEVPAEGVLWLPAAGLYPVTVETRLAGRVTARAVTFVQREPGPADPRPASLAVALAVGTDVPVVLDANGKVQFDATTLAALTRLAEILETSQMPATVNIAPQLLAGLREANPALADRFAAVLANTTILSAPVLPLDPSAAAAAGQGQLYSDWLAAGEDLFGSAALPGTTLRAAAAVTTPLDEAGGEMLRGLGTRLLLLPPSTYDRLDGNIGAYTTTQLVRVQLRDERSFEAIVVDRPLGATLAAPSAQPFADAVFATAELLATRQEIIDRGADPRRNSVLLATDEIGLPDPARLAALTALIATTPELAVSSVSQLGASTDVQQVEGRDETVSLPVSVGAADITSRLALQTDLRAASSLTASMLVDGDPRPAQWQAELDLLPSSALDAGRAGEIATSLRNEMQTIRAAVHPPSNLAFTLTGRSGVVRLKLSNSAATALKVRIRLDAAAGKLSFADEQEKLLAANATTEVEVRIRARSNGRFPVYLTILAPADITAAAPIARARLTATVLGLTGLGNLFTGAALLMLATWWVHHVRSNRRRTAAAEALGRHPVSSSGNDPSLDDSGLSPDAATSTLDGS